MSAAKTAIVIPAYNEEKTIRDVAQECLQYCETVIVVDDGSADSTVQQLQSLPVELLQNSVNSGKAAALWRGMQHAIALGVDQVITMDGDGQHRPDDIPALLEKAESSPEHLIIAARLRDTHLAPPARLAANRFADFWISWAAGQWIRDTQSGYRLYPASLLKGIQPNITKQRGFVFESEIIIDALRGHYSCTYVPIASSYSADARASHFRPVADITQIVLMVAWRLLSRGFYPQGLWRVLKQMRSAGRDAGAS